FVDDPFTPGGRLYKTGDLGRHLADGTLDYLGRNDFQVKLRGFRIELGEIEARLRECAGVREAAVVARADGGEQRLVAYVVGHAGAELAPADLRAALSAVLSEYMVPGAFVRLDALPLTPNGKLDRRGLPAPDASALVARAYAAPQGAVETALAQAWCELLGLERVGRDDNFFELGGHSLLAVRLVARLRQRLDVELALRDVFAQPALAGMAGVIAGSARAVSQPIVAADRARALPLSLAQQRLWFLAQMDPAAGAAYHIPAALRLEGVLDRAALKGALDRIVARHESLRTVIVDVEGTPTQQVGAADGGFALREQDLGALDAASRQRALGELQQEEARRPFVLSAGPLIRGQLVRLGEREHVLLVTQHHIVSDGWSIGVLIREVSALYAAFSQGLPDPLAPLAIQYADYALWQRQWLQGAVLQGQLDFWRAQLRGAPELMSLPLDHPRPPVQSYRGGQVPVRFTASLSARLQALSQRHNTTLFMTLLAGWAALLARLSGQDDVVIGTAVANRQRGEVEPLIGFFVNTLALRVRLEDDPDAAALLAQVKASTLAAYANQEVPFDQVVEALQPSRKLSHSPLFQVMFAFDNISTDTELRMPGLALSRIETEHETSHFDLGLSLAQGRQGLVGTLEYASDLFERASVERLAAYLPRLLEAMVGDEHAPLSRAALLDQEQWQELVVGLNATGAPLAARCAHQLFEARAAARPQAPALVYEGTTLDYGQLNRRANQVAHYLIGLGIGRDERVAVCLERGVEMVVGLLGVLKAGAAYVPLDPAYPAQRLAYMLDDSAPRAVLTQRALAHGLAAACPVIALDGDGAAALARQPDGNPDPAALGLRPDHLAYIIYTSGSTGQPKGAMVEHAGLTNLALAQIALFGVGPESRVLQFASISFDASASEIMMALCSGAQLVLAARARLLPGAPLREVLARHAVTHVTLPASALPLLAEQEALPAPITLVVAGDVLPPDAARHWSRRHRVFNAYGPTEATVCATAYLCDAERAGAVPIGRPIANTRVYVLDRHLQPVPRGVAGELHIGGAGVGRGYLNRAELTAERFVDDPFTPGGRLYKTGDLGRHLADGTLDYLGRNDFQVKLRGFRIELG
ncbi:MAG TPA: amino acid adenylation domain-containing protein, partial [Duganella sp.]|uniref:amino acid adenylation domain-containing protein n=1 Tax=Duganella sp. TaxID=1904440 RepID=UPI002ED54383